MDLSILEELGLSKGEIKTYLALLRIGRTKIGAIIEKSGMASSAVHNSINSLLEKGLVSYFKEGKIKIYKAVSPKQLIDFIDGKKKKLIEILPDLEFESKFAKERQDVEIFSGMKGITSMLNILINRSRRGDEYLFFAINVKEQNKVIQDFLEVYDLKRREKGLIIRGLAPRELRKYFVNRKIIKMRYPNFLIPSNISIFKDKIAFFSWGEKPVGYLITSKQIADMYRDFFHEIWSNSR